LLSSTKQLDGVGDGEEVIRQKSCPTSLRLALKPAPPALSNQEVGGYTPQNQCEEASTAGPQTLDPRIFAAEAISPETAAFNAQVEETMATR